MTCQHVPITRQTYSGLTVVRCAYGHWWREAPIRMAMAEHETWLLILALYLPRKTDK
jgi:hypothetical protein